MTIHEFSIGNWRAVALHDTVGDDEAVRMAANVAPNELERELTVLGSTFPTVTISYNCLAVQTPDGWVLMDGGQGTLTGGDGQLLTALDEAGIAPEDIALIFISHCHADHYGGLIHDETGAFVFANAQYATGAREWEFWTSSALLDSLQRDNPPHYEAVITRLMPIAPRLRLLQLGDTLVPGMTVIDAPGHTPGHLALLMENGGDAVLYIGDAAVHPIHLKHPDYQFFNDREPEKSPETRRALMRLSRAKNARIHACHFVFPGFFDLQDDWPEE